MKKAKKKGKSYSQGWFERQSRRFMSVLLPHPKEGMKDRNFHWKKKTSGRQSGMLLKKGRQ